MPGWDYSRNGYYYITMVIKEFDPILGHIENDEMILSDFGEIAFDEWIKSFEIRDELLMDEFTFMPDHMHAIIILKNTDGNGNGIGNDGNRIGNDGNRIGNDGNGIGNDGNGIGNDGNGIGNDGNGIGNVQTHGRASQTSPASDSKSHLHRLPKSISSFIAGYKSATTTEIDNFIDLHNLPIPKYNRNNRLWHINYHDHIIRDDGEYKRIKQYIIDNPKNWKKN
jgi:REP element-mobilizing transposase RayT